MLKYLFTEVNKTFLYSVVNYLLTIYILEYV